MPLNELMFTAGDWSWWAIILPPIFITAIVGFFYYLSLREGKVTGLQKWISALVLLVTFATAAWAADTKLSALTELAATPAASDEFYVNDGGTSKKIQYSNMMDGEALANDSVDDDSIDFSDVTCADLTMSDCGAVTATSFTIGSAGITEAELEILDGATVTTTELNYVSGVSSAIQTQIGHILDGTTAFTDFNGAVLDSDNYVNGSIDLAHLAAGVYAKDIVTTAPLTGATDNVLVGADSDVTLAIDFTASFDFSGASGFILRSANDDPDTNAGDLLHDSTVSNFTNGAVRYYNGAAVKQLVDMTAATAEACTDDYVVAYDADADLWYCKQDADSGGATAWDDVGNPDADDTIALTGYEVGWSSTLDSAGKIALLLSNSDSDMGASTTFFQIESADNDETNNIYFRIADDSGGDDDTILQVIGTATEGALQMADGAAGTPSYSFASDPNTGLYSPTADQIGFSLGGTMRLKLNTTGGQVQDDNQWNWGDNNEFRTEYDENGQDVMIFWTAKTASQATDTALWTFAADSGNSGMTADQEIFEIGKGDEDDSQANFTELFAVDEDGDVYIAGDLTVDGSIITAAADDPAIDYDPSTASESEWWTGVNHDSEGDDDDPFEWRQSATPGTSVEMYLEPDGDLFVTGDVTVTGSDLSVGAAGVKLTGDGDGAITFLGMGDGADEDLTLNLDDTANEVVVSSSTSVATINFPGIGIKAPMEVTAADGDGETLATADLNTVRISSGAGDWDLPDDSCDAATGNWITVVANAAHVASITSADSSDVFVLSDGTSLDAGDELDTEGGAWDSCTVLCVATNTWVVVGERGTCADGGTAD